MLQPRPLKRDRGSLRDDRLYIVACDDTYAPAQYFGFFRNPRVQVHVVPAVPGQSDPASVLEALLLIHHEPDDERWLLLDTDHYLKPSHKGGFIAVLKKAGQTGVRVALSRPCFELWLLLHHVDFDDDLARAAKCEAVGVRLRMMLGGYNKTNLRPEDFPRAAAALACRRSRQRDDAVGAGMIPEGNTSRVHLLWESIVANASPAQIPDEFRDILV